MAYNYEDKLVETIKYIADSAVAAAPYDKTIQCTIMSCEDESTGKYKVQYQDAIFYAYSGNVDTTYSDGSNVYVLVPGNDSSREKTILGEVNKLGEKYMSIVDNDILYFPIGGNVVDISNDVNLDLFRLWSYQSTNPTKEIPFIDSKEATSNDKIRIDNTILQHNLEQVNYIKLGAKFTTNIPFEQQADLGSYGIIFTLKFKTNSGIEDEYVNRTYTIDINDIINNPYGLDNSEQTLIFPVDGKNFLSVEKIEIYSRDFPIQKEHSEDSEVRALEYDIEIKDFIINAMDKIDESKLNGPWITIVCPEGNSFDSANVGQTKNIRVNTYKGTQQINAQSKKLQYFWFVEDARVDPGCEINVTSGDKDITQPDIQIGQSYFDAFYCKYGGYGWKCLNKFHLIEEETDEKDEHGQPIIKMVKEWESADFNYEIKERNLVARETKYKCAVLYNEYLMTDVKTFINYNSQYDINITTDTGENIFYFDTGEPILTCNVNPSGNYSYLWNKTNNLGKISYIKDATEKKYQIYIRDIYNFATYTCFVYNDGAPIGQATITITNSLESGGQYSLVIINGTQVYKYNEYGLAPNEGSTDDPVVIQPLGYILYDMLGKEVRHDIIADQGKEWLIPAEKTMLIFDLSGINPDIYYNADGTDYTMEDEEAGKQKWYKFTINEREMGTDEALSYKIKDRYDYKYINNTVRLKIKYQGTYFVAETNFVFTKEGEPGTNGSEYYCRIIPNSSDMSKIDTNKPLIIIDEDYIEGAPTNLIFCNNKRRIPSSEIAQKNFLKAELWRNGQRVIGTDERDNNSNKGTSTEGISYNRNWSFLQNIYTKNYVYDYSYLENGKININVDEESWQWEWNETKYKTDHSESTLTDNFVLTNSRDYPYPIPYYWNNSRDTVKKKYYNAPALISKCIFEYSVDVKNKTNYYANYPLIWVKTNDDFKNNYLEYVFDLEGGFNTVIYAADGRRPQYHDDPFKIIIQSKINDKYIDISNKFDFEWRTYGGLFEALENETDKKWVTKTYMKEITYSSDEILLPNEHRYKPQDEYNGHCVNNIIECYIQNKENELSGQAIIQIPIHFMLNRYGHAALNDWDGNSISIKDDTGVILAPQVGAGEKDENNSFTGVLMRKSKRSKS